MKYRVCYKRRSDRDPNRWAFFEELLDLKGLYDLLRWLEKQENHQLIAIEPVSGGEK